LLKSTQYRNKQTQCKLNSHISFTAERLPEFYKIKNLLGVEGYIAEWQAESTIKFLFIPNKFNLPLIEFRRTHRHQNWGLS